MDAITVIGNVAVVITILSFASGLPLCSRIYKNKSSTGIPYLPILAGSFSTYVWLQYGLTKPDSNVIFVNTIGIVFQMMYVIVYYIYTRSRDMFVTTLKLGILVALQTSVYSYIHHVAPSPMQAAHPIGLIGSAATLFFLSSPLLGVAEVIRKKSSESLEFIMIFSSFVVTFLWTVYGVLLNDPILYGPNLAGVILTGIQLILCAVYPKKPKVL